MSSKGKRKRQELDLKTRYEVIKFSDANPQESTRKLAEKFSCGRTQIQRILLKRVEIVAAFEANASSDTKRSRQGKNVEIDSALLEWFRKARSKNIPISGPILQEKALQIAKALDVAPSEFKASNGWLDRFKNRNGIKPRFISGEAGDVSKTPVDSWKKRLPDVLHGWELENIWNMDETGQFFRDLPNKSLADSSRNCTGGKNLRRD